jgi:hypothetical protein
MGMMIIRHKVRDYGLWRPIFNEHAEMQKAAGLTNPRVYHSADSNKSEIVVVFDTEDTKRAERQFEPAFSLTGLPRSNSMRGVFPRLCLLMIRLRSERCPLGVVSGRLFGQPSCPLSANSRHQTFDLMVVI